MLVFEDLHWSSDSLLDLAEFVMLPRGESALLMLVLARPELLDRRPNWGGGRLNHLAIALEPLGSSAIADLVRHLLDTDAPDVIRLVSERAEGNPFYAGELVRSYLEHGSLEQLPDTVQATVLARLDLLPADERRVLQLGSVYGRTFRPSGVAALGGEPEPRVVELCENLADRDLIRPAEPNRYNFRHILIQEVAYGTLTRAERARLHAQAAHWVESTSQGREVAVAEILAFHYREAAVLYSALEPETAVTQQIRGDAAKWLLKAADVAVAAAATPEAVRHIRSSFDFVDQRFLPRLHERIGDLTAGDSGLEEYRLALELYEAENAPVDDQLRALAGMLTVATRWAGSVGDRPSDEWMAELRGKGRRLLERATDQFAIGRFLAADAFFVFWIQGRREPTHEELRESEASAARAMEIARELGNAELESTVLDAMGGFYTAVNDWRSARETAERRIAIEDKLGLYERLDAHSVLAWMSYLMGDLETADRDSAQMAARLLPGQAPYPALHLYSWRAATLRTLGRWDEAVAVFWRAMEAWHDAGSHAAGYGLRGFLAGFDVGKARGDARLTGAAVEAIESIIARFPRGYNQVDILAYCRDESGFEPDDQSLRYSYPVELAERRFSLAADRRQSIPQSVLDGGLDNAVRIQAPLLEAQIRRARGLAMRDEAELARAIAIWEPRSALPALGRARAERGVIRGDASESEAGLAILKKLGDVHYLDSFAARV